MLTATRKDATAIQDNAIGAAQEAGRKTRDFINNATQNTRSAIAATEREVREHPVRSSLVAAGVGFLLGMLMRR